MKRWIRRLRGILGIASLWGLAGSFFGCLGGIAASAFGTTALFQSVVVFGILAGGVGFVLGAGFASLLATLEQRRTLDELSPGRAAVWGALAGVTLPLSWLLFLFVPRATGVLPLETVLTALLAATVSYGALSAALAAATVALARRAPDELAERGESEILLQPTGAEGSSRGKVP